MCTSIQMTFNIFHRDRHLIRIQVKSKLAQTGNPWIYIQTTNELAYSNVGQNDSRIRNWGSNYQRCFECSTRLFHYSNPQNSWWLGMWRVNIMTKTIKAYMNNHYKTSPWSLKPTCLLAQMALFYSYTECNYELAYWKNSSYSFAREKANIVLL